MIITATEVINAIGESQDGGASNILDFYVRAVDHEGDDKYVTTHLDRLLATAVLQSSNDLFDSVNVEKVLEDLDYAIAQMKRARLAVGELCQKTT